MQPEDDGWTLKTLEVYLSEKIDALRQLVDQRQTDYDKAIDSALKAMDRRLEGMNEIRGTLSDQRVLDEKHRSETAGTFLSKEVYKLEHDTLQTVINKNAERIAEIDKKLFALSELKADKREGLSSKYMFAAILFAGLSFIASVVGIAYNIINHIVPKLP